MVAGSQGLASCAGRLRIRRSMLCSQFGHAFLIMLLVAHCALSQSDSQRNDLLESGRAEKLSPPPNTQKDFTLVTYNIRWRTGSELQEIADWLKRKPGVAVIALQEVDRAKERTGKTNNARVLAESLGMYYAWAAPPLPGNSKAEEETGVELLSPYPLTDIARIVLPHAGPGSRSRVALGATVNTGKTNVRIYSVHAETRISVSEKMDQFRAVLVDLARFPKTMPAVVSGDFNSWEPATVKNVRELFTKDSFTTPFSDDEPTFRRSAVLFDVELKLDWIWLRGLTAKTRGIDRAFTVSDHLPLWTVASF
jgi:endonuclease/exonuclease/phosphatase family metal-dependent hydrolase